GQGEVHLVRVVDLPSAYGKMKTQAYMSDSMQEAAKHEEEKYVKTVAERLREGPFAAFKLNITSSIALSPNVAATLLKQAERAEGAERSARFDVIALATHNRSGLRRLLMGSVTERILDSTKLPLMSVRPREDKTAGEESGATTK